MDAINASLVTKQYRTGTKALQEISLQVAPGDFFALLGPNGAGKTTFINILCGLVTKTSGTVSVFGHDLDAAPAEVRASIGVVPQEFNFSIFESVENIIIAQAGYYGVPRAQAKLRVDELLETLGLADKRKSPSRALSGGMKRRLMIARALVHQPKLLVLDEPTAGVDVELRYGMWEYLRKLNAAGTTVLLTTHYLEEVEQMCRTMAIINNGQIVREGSVRSILASLEKQSYLITVDKLLSLEKLPVVSARSIDSDTFEATIAHPDDLQTLLRAVDASGMAVRDIRPSANRLEQLFMDVIGKKV